ncbi:MAG: class I SAM-dependent methyltransferase [Leptolyngbyaceae cyanobacterium MO_188.B28]|nr:class I SAM-dependent methyltransferase [Leptolyngbyaceae cyanobacterium MO_188.B28]
MAEISSPGLASRLVNGILSIKPLYAFAKHRARAMMIERAESLGVFWRDELKKLQARGGGAAFSDEWARDLDSIRRPDLTYPDYYITSFHAYEEGNLGWLPAMEVESAAYAVHARIWPEAGIQGDARLRQSYHDVLKSQLPEDPKEILDMGCGVGMSTFTLQQIFPSAQMTGLDLSPYFLAIARYREQLREEGRGAEGAEGVGGMGRSKSKIQNFPSTRTLNTPKSIQWIHAPAEATGLPEVSFDLVSICLVFHELPEKAAVSIIREARRLLRPGGHLAIMDMNPQSEAFLTMPPYVLTLLKSTEPYLDQYFALGIEAALVDAGFHKPSITVNSPRHRTVLAQAK